MKILENSLKMRDLGSVTSIQNPAPDAVRAAATNMFIDPSTSVAALTAGSAQANTYTYSGGMDWMRLAMSRIIDEYFRDPGSYPSTPDIIIAV